MLADEIELHSSHSDLSVVENTLEDDVENVSIWLVVNKLISNVIKLCMCYNWLMPENWWKES